MNAFDSPNSTVTREQQAVNGQFLFFQKAKLMAVHVFREDGNFKDGQLTLTVNGEQVGVMPLTESFAGPVQSTAFLGVMIPQGAVVKVDGASNVVAEYVVVPDADQTTTKDPDRN